MKPDRLDIKIREAAAHDEPAFTEEAWNTMEKLLDKKMPVEKKDKRKIFWLFFLLFIVLGSTFLIIKTWRTQQEDSGISIKSDKVNSSDSAQNRVVKPKTNTVTGNIVKAQIPIPVQNMDAFKKANFSNKTGRSNSQDILDIQSKATDDKVFSSSEKEIQASKNQQNVDPVINKEFMQKGDKHIATGNIQNDSIAENKNSIADSNVNSIAKNKTQNIIQKKTTSVKARNNFINSFSIQVSVGPDVSFISLKNIGKVRPIYGAGISYAINKKLAVKTGFFVARKVYDALPSEYYPPSGFWNYYPDLKNIEADCKIYEVPIGVNYYFHQTKNQQWFGSAALSSYFMKKEVYDYYSKTPTGQTSYNTFNIQNKNRHFFSSLRLAAGYEKKIGKNISLIAEPYINIPLYGIGYGKVKLYSTGVLFSISIKPFSKK